MSGDVFIVQRNEQTPYQIAREAGIDCRELIRLNPRILSLGQKLQAGTVLFLVGDDPRSAPPSVTSGEASRFRQGQVGYTRRMFLDACLQHVCHASVGGDARPHPWPTPAHRRRSPP